MEFRNHQNREQDEENQRRISVPEHRFGRRCRVAENKSEPGAVRADQKN